MTQLVQKAALIDLVRRILVRYGASESNAAIIAANCVGAEADGAASHGLFRVPGYVATLKSGWLDAQATPVFEEAAPGVVRVDAHNGFAQVALALARPRAIERAREAGICLIAIRNSHHFGALWPDVEPFAREGFIALTMVNSRRRVVPHGGRKPVYGTNPMGFACPRENGEVLVFDQATSAMAHGDVMIAAEEGHDLPPGSAVDRDGNPTTNPRAVLDGGALLPFGGIKGSSIAMMIEVLAAALTGGSFSFEVDSSAFPGAQTPRAGQLVILIDPAKAGARDFTRRIETLIAEVQRCGQTRLPGDRRHRQRQATMSGIPVEDKVMERLESLLR